MSSSKITNDVITIDVIYELTTNQQMVRHLRKWSVKEADPICRKAIKHVLGTPNLGQGLAILRKDPAGTVLVTIGIEKSRVYQQWTPKEQEAYEIIIASPPSQQAFAPFPTSSLLSGPEAIVVNAPEEAIRKSILRLMTKQYAEIRLLNGEEDYEKYFALRYRVWKEMGYIPEAMRCDTSEWELDFADRNALPIGAFSKDRDGRLLGTTRLVDSFGPEAKAQVRLIQGLIDANGDPQLLRNFTKPLGLRHQFDLLEAFDGFKEYYKRLHTDEALPAAEVSRVIVAPECRGRGLGEVLVDSLVSHACKRRLRTLFLACVKGHERFYGKCGFRRIRGLACKAFPDVNVAAIAMDRSL